MKRRTSLEVCSCLWSGAHAATAPGLNRQARRSTRAARLRPLNSISAAPRSQSAQLSPPIAQQCPLPLLDLFLHQTLNQRSVAVLGWAALRLFLVPGRCWSGHGTPLPLTLATVLSLALQDSCPWPGALPRNLLPNSLRLLDDGQVLPWWDGTFGVLPTHTNSAIIFTKF